MMKLPMFNVKQYSNKQKYNHKEREAYLSVRWASGSKKT